MTKDSNPADAPTTGPEVIQVEATEIDNALEYGEWPEAVAEKLESILASMKEKDGPQEISITFKINNDLDRDEEEESEDDEDEESEESDDKSQPTKE